MNRIRHFEIVEDVLTLTTVFYSNGDDVDLPLQVEFVVLLSPEDKSYTWLKVNPISPDVPMNLMIEENLYLLNLLKTMFYA